MSYNKLIKTEAEYNDALKRIDELFDAEQGTSEADELELLVALVELYEKEHFPMSRIEDFVETYTNIIREIKSLGKIPVLLSLPPIDSNRYFNQISKGLSAENILKWMEGNRQFITNWHERYNIEIFKLAIAEEVPVIDITSVFLEHKNYSHYLCEDGIHPNEKGSLLMFDRTLVDTPEIFI